jgi:KDO2-lipid IV(A) lauroyltransferase
MYYLIYVPLFLLSLLPLRALYVLSDTISFFLFRVFGYRRKIIEGNLFIAFPEKTIEERKAIARKFHRNFTDSFMETIKSLSAPKSFYDKHCAADFSVFHELEAANLSSQMHACHQFNWEWVSLHWSLHFRQLLAVVYMPIASKPIDKLFYKLRTKYGAAYLPATGPGSRQAMMALRKKIHCLVLIADQKPASAGSSYWLNFFGKPTPFITGPEKNAVLKKCPVVFGKAHKTGRGKYGTTLILACKDASLLKPGELTLMYRDFIEQAIKENPDMYLWSHNRFKHEWEEGYRHLWIDSKPI